MARYTQPRTKLMRKIGTDVGLKTNPVKVSRRLGVLPGFHGRKGRRKLSDYGTQLLEKQKVRIMYGILEKQFVNYFEKASRNPKATGAALLVLLERRLDNVIYRLGLAPTRAAARQLVSHGNVKVDNAKVSIPSYQVKPGQVVQLTDKASKIPYISTLLSEKNVGVPAWLERKQGVGKVVRMPERDDMSEQINEQLIVEFYSK